MQQIKVTAEQRGLSIEIDRQQFALALKTWRLRQGMTQKQVGERWGLSRYTIIRLEEAKPCSWTMAYKVFAKLSNELVKEAGK